MKKKKNQNRAVTTSGSSRTVNYNLEFLDRGRSYKYQQVLCIASPMSSRCFETQDSHVFYFPCQWPICKKASHKNLLCSKQYSTLSFNIDVVRG